MVSRRAAALFGIVLAFPVPPAAAQKLRVVATTSDLRALVEAVGKNGVDATHLAPPGRDAESYEPRPQNVKRLREAQLMVRVGLDYDLWLDRLLADAGNPALRKGGKGYVDASVGVPLLDVRATSLAPTPGHAHGHGNPHYWLDPANAEVITGGILEGLMRVDPAHARSYRANRQAFLDRLRAQLDAWRKTLEPYAGTPVVVFHDSWPYFARRFRLHVVDQIEAKPGVPASPAHLAELIRKIRDNRVTLIIRQPFEPGQTPNMLAERSGAAVIALAPSVGAVPGTEDYPLLFDYNVRLLATALAAKTARR